MLDAGPPESGVARALSGASSRRGPQTVLARSLISGAAPGRARPLKRRSPPESARCKAAAARAGLAAPRRRPGTCQVATGRCDRAFQSVVRQFCALFADFLTSTVATTLPLPAHWKQGCLNSEQGKRLAIAITRRHTRVRGGAGPGFLGKVYGHWSDAHAIAPAATSAASPEWKRLRAGAAQLAARWGGGRL